ncbi:MAG: response regulator [Nanoarchaeota archaeon]|nr:response regulator [Nanoarchaeota archaeon]
MLTAKVLIVEDEALVARDLDVRLRKMGFKVTGVASTGKDAIKSVEKERPDVVLMDIYLKGAITGIEAAKDIWKRFKVPVIYVTAYSDEKTVKKAMETGPIGYILKPIDEKELFSALGQALDSKDLK